MWALERAEWREAKQRFERDQRRPRVGEQKATENSRDRRTVDGFFRTDCSETVAVDQDRLHNEPIHPQPESRTLEQLAPSKVVT